MRNWTPDQWNSFFIYATGFVVMICVQLSNMVINIRNGFKADKNTNKIDDAANKLDVNNKMTSDIHQVTNGPLSLMEQNVRTIVTQAATNAAVAAATAEAAKVQAVHDAIASKDK